MGSSSTKQCWKGSLFFFFFFFGKALWNWTVEGFEGCVEELRFLNREASWSSSTLEKLIWLWYARLRAFLNLAHLVKNLPAIQETPVQFLGQEDPLEKGSAAHSNIFGLPLWLSW